MDEEKQFIHIPGWMWTRLDLSGNELLAYAVVCGFCGRDGGDFHASQQWLAARLGCRREAVVCIMQRLEKKGLVKKQRQGSSLPNLYTAVLPPAVCANRTQGSAKSAQGPCENRTPLCAETAHKKKEKKKIEKDSQTVGEIRTNITEEDLIWITGQKKAGSPLSEKEPSSAEWQGSAG